MPITNQGIHSAYKQPTDDRDSTVVEASGNSIELYISVGAEGPSHALPIHRETIPSHGGYHKGGSSHVDAGGSNTDDVEAVQDQRTINLNSVPEVPRAAVTSDIL